MINLIDYINTVFEAKDETIPMITAYKDYHIFFNGWQQGFYGAGFTGDADTEEVLEYKNGTVTSPRGIVFLEDSYSDKFFKDFKIKTLAAPQYICFRGDEKPFKGINFESEDIRIERGGASTFMACGFDTRQLRLEPTQIKFANVKGDVELVQIYTGSGYPDIDSRGSKIKADRMKVTIYYALDANDFCGVLRDAGIEVTIGKGSKAEVSVADGSLVDTLFTTTQDHIWQGVKTLEFDVKMTFPELKRLKNKRLIFTVEKKGSGYEVTSFEEKKA